MVSQLTVPRDKKGGGREEKEWAAKLARLVREKDEEGVQEEDVAGMEMVQPSDRERRVWKTVNETRTSSSPDDARRQHLQDLETALKRLPVRIRRAAGGAAPVPLETYESACCWRYSRHRSRIIGRELHCSSGVRPCG